MREVNPRGSQEPADPLALAPEKLLELKVMETVARGKVVFDR